MPLPLEPLVVNSGSKIRRRTLSFMPTPVSPTSTAAARVPTRAVRIVSVPPAGIAWTALRTRLTITSRSSVAVPWMGGTGRRSRSTRSATPRRRGSLYQ